MIRVSVSESGHARVHVGRLIDVESAEAAIAELAQAKSIELVIDSHGGCANAAERLFLALSGRPPSRT